MNIKDIFFELPNEYFCDDMNMAILDDCFNSLSKIKDKSVDLIFADPPYNIGKDFGNNKDTWNSINDYIDWCKKWIDECFRVLKDTGTFYFMTATQHMPFLDIYIQKKYNVISRIVWTYDSSGVQSKKCFGSLYEPIIMADKKKNIKYTFNAQDILIEAPTGSKRKLIDYRKTPPAPYADKKLPGNVWHFNRVRFLMDEYENHPTQKPIELLKRIILTSSNEGEIVLDPFSGSFTTSYVAKMLNRKSIGIEINEDYYKIGLRRLNLAKEYKGLKLIKIKERKTKNKSKKDHINKGI